MSEEIKIIEEWLDQEGMYGAYGDNKVNFCLKIIRRSLEGLKPYIVEGKDSWRSPANEAISDIAKIIGGSNG